MSAEDYGHARDPRVRAALRQRRTKFGEAAFAKTNALALVEKSLVVRKSAEDAYDESLRVAIEAGCSNVMIAEVVGQSESAVRRYIDRRGLRRTDEG